MRAAAPATVGELRFMPAAAPDCQQGRLRLRPGVSLAPLLKFPDWFFVRDIVCFLAAGVSATILHSQRK